MRAQPDSRGAEGKPGPCRPDYAGGSIVNLMASLELGCGGRDALYEPLRLLPPERVAEAKHVVLLLVDGLGFDFFSRHGRKLAPGLLGSITSVFPTSTAPAITSLLTASAPQQHAITGWHMHLRELGVVTAVLPFRSRWGGPCIADSGIAVEPLIGRGAWTADAGIDACTVCPRDIAGSAFNRALSGGAPFHAFSDLPGCFEAIVQSVTERHRYTYAYWPGLDKISHQLGCESRAAVDHLRRIENEVVRLGRRLSGSGTLFLVTADHGFIDIDDSSVTWLHDHPELAQCLAQPLCGEARAAFLHVRAGRTERLERYVADRLADRFDLVPAEELVTDQWLGLGAAEDRLLDRIGDYMLIGKHRNVIKDRLPHEAPWRVVGVHGGRDRAEMYVPLLAWNW